MTTSPPASGHAPVNGLRMYYEIHGQGDPLVLLHGGLHSSATLGALLPRLAEGRRVIAADPQGHGRTADIDRPLAWEALADDVAALLDHLGVPRADLMGYSLGGSAALQTAIRHPERVRRLVLVSIAYAKSGWYPGVRAGMDGLSATAAEFMKPSPLYRTHAAIAPRPEEFPALLDKLSALLRPDYDWSEGVAALDARTMLVYADHDSIDPAHMIRFFGLLGGGKGDPGQGGLDPDLPRFAVLPGTTHYDVFESPLLPALVEPFLDAADTGEAA